MHTPYSAVRLCCALFLSIAFASTLLSQTPLPRNERGLIVYQSPNNGDLYVPAKTTLTLRLNAQIPVEQRSNNFSFELLGEKSGSHRGKVIIADDNETIIFRPSDPFTLNERVDVTFRIIGMENIPPVSYSFRITPLSEQEQTERLQYFLNAEKQKYHSTINNNSMVQSIDTMVPPHFVVDTLVPGKIAPGDIYTAQNDYDAFVETLDNTAAPLYKHPLFNPPCEDFRPWQNKYYSYIYNAQVFLLDSDHNPIDTFTCGNGYRTDDHEFQLLPNGHVLLMANDLRDTDMRSITGDSSSIIHGTVIGAIIQELDTKKNVVFQWRSWDYFDATDVAHLNYHNPNLRELDYCHLNSLCMDTDGNIIASFREMDEVTKINRTNGKIIWRWGGKNNMFTFANNSVPFSYQHDIRRIANGHITMMDNGNYHQVQWGDGTVHDTAWSRAIEYDLDESSLRATPVWEYDHIDFTTVAGNVQRLPNGNTFICSGNLGLQKVIEVTPDGEKVFQLSFPVSAFSFRVYRFPTPPSSSSDVRSHDLVSSFQVRGIYPNPAQQRSAVTFSTTEAGLIRIDVFNMLGASVFSTEKAISGPGRYSADLDLDEIPTGIYYCKVALNGSTEIRKLVIQR